MSVPAYVILAPLALIPATLTVRWLKRRREARESAADAARILRAVQDRAAEVAMLHRWYAAESAEEPT